MSVQIEKKENHLILVKFGTYLSSFIVPEIIEFILPIIRRGGVATGTEIAEDIEEIIFRRKSSKDGRGNVTLRKKIAGDFFFQDISDGRDKALSLRFTTIEELVDFLLERKRVAIKLFDVILNNEVKIEKKIAIFLLRIVFHIFGYRDHVPILFAEALMNKVEYLEKTKIDSIFELSQNITLDELSIIDNLKIFNDMNEKEIFKGIIIEYINLISRKTKVYLKRNHLKSVNLQPFFTQFHDYIRIANQNEFRKYLSSIYELQKKEKSEKLLEFTSLDEILSSYPMTVAEQEKIYNDIPDMLKKIDRAAQKADHVIVILRDGNEWLGEFFGRKLIKEPQLKKFIVFLKPEMEKNELIRTIPKIRSMIRRKQIIFKEIPKILQNNVIFSFKKGYTLLEFEAKVGEIKTEYEIIEKGKTVKKFYIETKEAVYHKDPYSVLLNREELDPFLNHTLINN